METVKGPLAEALARHRDELNARFAARQFAGHSIDGTGFLEHLAMTVAPIVQAVERVLPERVDAVVLTLYDLSLELFATKWLGPEMKDTSVRAAWQTVLPQAPLVLAREPGRVAGSISNAVINLVGVPGARTQEWLSRLAALAPCCTNATSLLQCGKVLAWQAGMAQYRESALDTAGQLEVSLAATTLGFPTDLPSDKLAEILERLRGDPWLTPADALRRSGAPGKLRIVSQAGGFRGFGGPFMRQPMLSLADDEFIVTDGAADEAADCAFPATVVQRGEPGGGGRSASASVVCSFARRRKFLR